MLLYAATFGPESKCFWSSGVSVSCHFVPQSEMNPILGSDARLDFLLVVVRCSHLLPVLLWSLVSHLYNLRFFWSFQSSDVFKWYRFHCWKPKHSILSRTESSLELSSSTTGGHSCSESNTVTSHPQLNINMWTVWSLPTGVLGKVQVFRFNPEEAKKRI